MSLQICQKNLRSAAAGALALPFLLALSACDHNDPVAPLSGQESAVAPSGPDGQPTGANGESFTGLGSDGLANSLAAGDFPFTTSVNSSDNAFAITQTGTGRAGRFMVENGSNSREALMASHDGTGVALYAIARGTGRAGYYRINNPSNSNAALIGDTDGTGAAIVAFTSGTGPGARFRITNPSNNSPALVGETNGTGNLLELLADGSEVGHIDRNGGLLLIGTVSGSIPTEGPGFRMMYHPAKAAFRAGRVDGTEWNDANVGNYSFATGFNTIASGHASVALGDRTIASGHYSTALGYRVSTNGHIGAMMLGDNSVVANTLAGADNSFTARFDGGYVLYSNAATSTGAELPAGGGAWSSLSDAAMKENYRELDGENILQELAAMSIREWNYISQDAAIRHVGPTAQDFHAAFGLGEDPKRISTVDADGIALLGVQALEARSRTQADRLAALERENAELRERLDRLERALLDRR